MGYLARQQLSCHIHLCLDHFISLSLSLSIFAKTRAFKGVHHSWEYLTDVKSTSLHHLFIWGMALALPRFEPVTLHSSPPMVKEIVRIEKNSAEIWLKAGEEKWVEELSASLGARREFSRISPSFPSVLRRAECDPRATEICAIFRHSYTRNQ